MMKMVNTARLSAIALLMVGSVGTAIAAPVSPIVTGTADVVFGATGTAMVDITPVTTLAAGKHNRTTIASGQVRATAGNIAYRFTPSVGTVTPGGKSFTRTVTGKSSAANKLAFYVNSYAPDGQSASESPSSPGWWVAPNNGSLLDLTFYTSAIDQIVSPDAYPISIDAAVWVE